MKIRTDYVTNSSSSSFIVSSKDQLTIPEQYKNVLIQLKDSDSVIENLSLINDYYEMDQGLPTEDLISKYNFTHAQINVLKAISMGEGVLYDKILNSIKEGNFLYFLLADRDWFYCQEELQNILEPCTEIDHRTDL